METNKYQLFPPLSPDEMQELEASILANGVLHSVVIDTDGNILDGHTRKAICDKHGLEYPTIEKEFSSEEEKQCFVISMNIARRQLSVAQKVEYWLKLRNLGMSLRALADMVGEDKMKVQRAITAVVAKKVAAGETVAPIAVTGKDGKVYSSEQSEAVKKALLEKQAANAAGREAERAKRVAAEALKTARVADGIIEPASQSASMGNSQPKPSLVTEVRPALGTIAELAKSILSHYETPDIEELVALLSSNLADRKELSNEV